MLKKSLMIHVSGEARKENIVFYLDYRVTVLATRLFRLEENKEKVYRDAPTQSVWYRNHPVQSFKTWKDEEGFHVLTSEAELILKENREDARIRIDNQILPITNEGNLKGTYRTLDGCNGGYFNENPPRKVILNDGVCSLSGISYFDDAGSLSLSKDGEILDFDDETAWDTKGYKTPEEYWKNEDLEGLKEKLAKMFEETKTNICTSDCNK